MESYETHVTLNKSPVWGPKTFPPGKLVWGPYNPPSLPIGSTTGSYEPRQETMRVVPSPEPSPSWGAVKRSGEIRMTPYEAERITTFNYLAGREGYAVDFKRAMDADVSVYPPTCSGNEFFELEHRWRQQGHFDYWLAIYGQSILLNDHRVVDTSSSIASTQTSAIASFKGGYDFLTELAEARQGLEFAKETSASLLSFFMSFIKEHGDAIEEPMRRNRKITARDLLRYGDSRVRKAGSAWLAYRYALMPLYYSYVDVKELIERIGITYQTYRSKDEITITRPSVAGRSNGLYEVSSGTITIRSTIKAAYSNAFLQDHTFNQVQWNPFATAWELVPLSFVFDWFVNVGDFIVASTSSDFSQDAVGCTSVKSAITVEAILRHAESRNISFVHYGHSFPSATTSCQKNDVTRTKSFQTNTTESCRSRVIEHYVRKPFDLGSASLSFNPSMNWKRAVDAVALSHNPLKKLLKRFRK